ncbi:glycosyltransferase [Persicobacter psychrovividus]|uniref:Glycosyl transferase n=1 Tax=Persicobacter psychrovividus TaxID=387638 RepID=A0ABN6LAB9_9BACT|nr:glycosyl transferase [Persicobacter psychrovividus]
MPKFNRTNKVTNRRISKSSISKTLLVEVAWEVCNQVGGIYTVIRSKAPTMVKKWEDNYTLLGPYVEEQASAAFEPLPLDEESSVCRAVKRMQASGIDVHYGEWLVTGKPKVVLVNPLSVQDRLGEIKYALWDHHGIPLPSHDDLLDKTIAFGELNRIFFSLLSEEEKSKKIIGHFHEWMSASSIPELRRDNVDISTVFTTHATMLGRYLAANDHEFYQHLPFFDWEQEAINFNIEPQVRIERAAAHGAHVLTTVSDVTGQECIHLLGRKPDEITPNGLNIERFTALHEFQNLHKEYKEKIHQFVMAHFFPSYTFDLDNTVYFFTSGRFEYKNKGFDTTLEALAKLNYRLKQEQSDINIVMFFITKRPYHSVNPSVLQSRAVMEELRYTTKMIQNQIGERLFYAAASSNDHRLPELNDFVDEYWKLRFRRTLQSWKSGGLPSVVTHNLEDDQDDEILNYLRNANLLNHEDDRVKVVYHPDFISPASPLFGMEYGQFVRGCHLGVFPSYYEPWGYTPLEAMASGVPSVTSDLAGFGDYVVNNLQDHEEKGIYVIDRKNANFDAGADQLAYKLHKFIKMDRRQRISQRNKTEHNSTFFDWHNLIHHYDKAHNLAISRLKK